MKTVVIQLTDEAYMFLEARARQTHSGLSIEAYSRSAIAEHVYQAMSLEKQFAAARAAVDLIDG